MKIAGLLLIIAGIMMFVATLFQIPAIYETIQGGSQKAITSIIIYNILLLLASVFFIVIGRKVRRSAIS